MANVFTKKKMVGAILGSESEKNKFFFGYERGCNDEDAISITMPVKAEQYVATQGLHPIFDMNLPEGALAEKLRRQFSKVIDKFDDLALLEIVGSSQIGRLTFSNYKVTVANEEQDEGLLTKMSSQDISAIINYNGTDDLFAALLDRYASRSGISGAQPKVMVMAKMSSTGIESGAKQSGTRVDRFTHRGATHIIKSWDPNEFPHLAENEFFCMRAAWLAGINIPNLKLSKNGKLLVVERFDLENGIYKGFEDFCVLSGKNAKDKYDGSYERIIKRIKDYVSNEYLNEALERFFKTIVLSCAVRNGDAHLKNFGVIYDNPTGFIQLSPTYDVVTTTVYINGDSMALTLDGSKKWPSEKALIDFGKTHCGYTDERARALIMEVVSGVTSAQEEMRCYISENAEFKEIGDQMLAQWSLGLQSFLRHDPKASVRKSKI